MSFFSIYPNYIGIEASPSALKIALVKKGRKGIEICLLKNISSEDNVNPLYNFPKNGMIVSALPSKETLVRPFHIKLKKEKDIQSALPFQAESLLPYPVEMGIIQSEVIEKRGDGTFLTLLSVRKDHLKKHLETLNEKKIEPEAVSAIPLALAALSTLFPQNEKASLIIHNGERETTCALVEHGKLLTSRAFDSDQNFNAELQKTILAFSSSHREKTFEKVIYIGSNSDHVKIIEETAGLHPVLTSSLSIPYPSEELNSFALAIGIAMTQFWDKKIKIDFRQQQFSYPKPLKRFKKHLLFFYLGAATLCFSLFGFGRANLLQKQERIHNQYLSLLELEEKNENNYKIPRTLHEYKANIADIHNEIVSRPDTFPLYPKIPKAREVIAWLSNLPVLNGNDGTLITIDTFNYTMVGAPEFSRKKEKYEVKVELEFSSKSPIVARKFHDVLLADNSFVDNKKEIEWTSAKDKFKTSFYLKDQTFYP